MKTINTLFGIILSLILLNGCMTSSSSTIDLSDASIIKRNFYKLEIGDTRKEVFDKLGFKNLDTISNNKFMQKKMGKIAKRSIDSGQFPDLLWSIPVGEKVGNEGKEILLLYFDISEPDFKLKCAIIGPCSLSIRHEGFQEGIVYPESFSQTKKNKTPNEKNSK